MAAIIYDGKAIIPAPLLSISKTGQTQEDGGRVGTIFEIQLKGKIFSDRGSPSSSGTFWTLSGYPPNETIAADGVLGAYLRKQDALRGLFANDGRTLECQSWDGSSAMSCNPRVKSINFAEGTWFNPIDYTITLEADRFSVGPQEDIGDPATYKISKSSDEWSIEAGDDKFRYFKISRQVSAVGKRYYDETGTLVKPAWQQARSYVLDRLGLGLKPERMVASGVLNADNLQAFNYMRSERVAELGGSYTVTENWTAYDPQGEPPAIDDFTVTSRVAENGLTSVSIEGNIQGYSVSNNTTYATISTRWANAQSKWGSYVQPNLLTRCQTISGATLHASPLNRQITYNEVNGTIGYNYQFDNRAANLVAGAITETISISDSFQTDIFASIPVLGRALGPVLQDIGTVTAKKRTISLEVVVPANTQSASGIKPSTNAIIALYEPAASVIFLDTDQESWSPKQGRYTRTVGFTYE